ncbi:T9SS type A sorting domain-containing protein [candidate division KSB1 bacterium]|nr:T9SS type A sorting domain-containing protein [candidate division KSB1 bacterium]
MLKTCQFHCHLLLIWIMITSPVFALEPPPGLIWSQKSLPILDFIQTNNGEMWSIGPFQDTLNVGRYTLISQDAWDVVILHMDSECNVIQAYTFGGLDDDEGHHICLAPDSGLIIAGRFESTLTFNNQTYQNESGHDLFIGKLSPQGEEEWMKVIPGSGSSRINGIDVGASGHIGIAGYTSGTLTFQSDTITVPFEYMTAGFVAEFDASGRELWALELYGGGLEYGSDVAINASGQCYATGSIGAEIQIGPHSMTPPGLTDGFLLKMTADGRVCWARSLGIGWWGDGTALVLHNDNDLYLTGDFVSSIVLGGTQYTNDGTQEDVYVARFDTSGQSLWGTVIGGPNIDKAANLVVDDSANVYTSGFFEGESVFGDETRQGQGDRDIYLMKLDSDGHIGWLHTIGGEGYDYCRTLGTDSRDHVVFSGAMGPNALLNNGDTLTQDRGTMMIRFGDPVYLDLSMEPDSACILFPPVGIHAYASGDRITLEAAPFEDYTFDHWEGDVEQADLTSTSMVIYNNQSVTAHVNYSSGVNPGVENVSAFHLYPVYPNPFNPATTIRFSLDSQSETIIQIYTLTGRIVKTLANSVFSAGHHEIKWNGTNATGMPVPSGIYMVKIETEKFSSTRKMILLK